MAFFYVASWIFLTAILFTICLVISDIMGVFPEEAEKQAAFMMFAVISAIFAAVSMILIWLQAENGPS